MPSPPQLISSSSRASRRASRARAGRLRRPRAGARRTRPESSATSRVRTRSSLRRRLPARRLPLVIGTTGPIPRGGRASTPTRARPVWLSSMYCNFAIGAALAMRFGGRGRAPPPACRDHRAALRAQARQPVGDRCRDGGVGQAPRPGSRRRSLGAAAGSGRPPGDAARGRGREPTICSTTRSGARRSCWIRRSRSFACAICLLQLMLGLEALLRPATMGDYNAQRRPLPRPVAPLGRQPHGTGHANCFAADAACSTSTPRAISRATSWRRAARGIVLAGTHR